MAKVVVTAKVMVDHVTFYFKIISRSFHVTEETDSVQKKTKANFTTQSQTKFKLAECHNFVIVLIFVMFPTQSRMITARFLLSRKSSYRQMTTEQRSFADISKMLRVRP